MMYEEMCEILHAFLPEKDTYQTKQSWSRLCAARLYMEGFLASVSVYVARIC